MAATLLLRNPPSYLGNATQQHSARNDRLTIGALWTPGAGSATVTPLAVSGGAVYGPAGTMGEVTLNSNTQITLNPARFIVPGGIDSKQGHYEAIHDQVDTMAVTAQDATLYRRSYLAVVVDDSETSGVATSATTDRGSVQVIDGPLAASAPAYPSLTAYPNRLLLGEFYIPPTGQTVTWTPYNPRTIARGGVLPVLAADASTVPGNSGAPGAYAGQYRDHPTLGLQRWDGTVWRPLPANYDSGDTYPTLNTGFTTNTASTDRASIRRIGNVVNFRGLVTRDTNTRAGTMCTLAQQFWPSSPQWFIPTASGLNVAQLDVSPTTGVVNLALGSISGASAAFVFSHTWITAQPTP